MKKTRLRLLSFIFAALLLMTSAEPLFAAEIPQATQGPSLSPSEVPEALSYEAAVAAGHVKRLYAEEESLNQVVFRNTDGTQTAYLFNETVKYVDAAGTVRDKSNALTRQIDGSYVNTANHIRTVYPRNAASGISLEKDDLSLILIPDIPTDAPTPGDAALVDGSSSAVIYDAIFGEDTALRYTQTYSGYKEDILLYSADVPSTFTFYLIAPHTSLREEGGRVIVTLDGEDVAVFEPISIYDANGSKTVGTVSVTEVLENRAFTMTVSVPVAFLQSATYPVTVDPTVTIRSDITSAIIDTTIYTNYSTSCGAETDLVVGNYNALIGSTTGRGVGRALINFPGLYGTASVTTDFEARMKSGRVTAVSYHFKDLSMLSSQLLSAFRMTQSWSESAVYSSSLWDGYSVSPGTTVSVTALNQNFYQSYTLNLLPFCNYWNTNNVSEPNGIMLKAGNETTTVEAVRIGSSESTSFSYYGISSTPYLSYTYQSGTSANTNIVDGGIYRIKSTTAERALTCSDSGIVSLGTYNASKVEQLFHVAHKGSGAYEISPVMKPDTRMVYESGSVRAVTANNTAAQRWSILTSNASTSQFRLHQKTDENKLLARDSTGWYPYVTDSATNAAWVMEYVGNNSVLINTPLIQQETPNTCSAACAVMVLASHGIAIDETDYVQAHASTYYDPTYFDDIITEYLNNAGSSLTYVCSYVSANTSTGYTGFTNKVIASLNLNSPVISIVCLSTLPNEFNYTTGGHYVVITGAYQDANGKLQAIVNDPHDNNAHYGRKIISFESMYQYIKDDPHEENDNDMIVHAQST